MHNRQIMVLSKAECRGIFREHARPRSIPNGAENPIWTVLGPCQMGFLASFGKAPGSGSCSGTPAAGAGGFRSRRGRRGTPTESPPSGVRAPHRAAGTARIWVPRTKRGPPFGGPLGRSGGEARIRTGGKGFAGLCLTTWPLRRRYEKGRFENRPDACDGADNGARTRDPNLGKVVLYQLSHVRLRVINIRDAAGGRKEFFKDC